MKKLTKEKCLDGKKELQFAYDHVGTKLDNRAMKDAISLGIVAYEKLMNEYFADQHNTDEFIHFKLHSDGTLRSRTKDELISYIHMLYHNWDVCDENLKNIADNITILDDALTRACNRIEYENAEGKMDDSSACPKSIYAFTPGCCREEICRMSNEKCWKEWFLHLAKQKNRK